MTRTTSQRILVLAFSFVALTSFGCAFGEIRPDDWFQRQYSLEEKHKSYSDFVRWAKFEEAASFMEKDIRAEYIKGMPDFDDVRFSDWAADPWTLDAEKRNATITVFYKGYSMRSMTIVEFKETQVWKRPEKGNGWKVVSTFENLNGYVKN